MAPRKRSVSEERLEIEAARLDAAQRSGLKGLVDAENTLILVERALDRLRDPHLDGVERASLTKRLVAARNAYLGIATSFVGWSAWAELFVIIQEAAAIHAHARTRRRAPEAARARLARRTAVVASDALLMRAIESWSAGGPKRNEAIRELAEELGIPDRAVTSTTVGQYISRWKSASK